MGRSIAISLDIGSNLLFRDLRRWISQERGLSSSSNGADSDPMNDSMKHQDHACVYSHHQPQQASRRRTKTYHGDTHSNIPPLAISTFGK